MVEQIMRTLEERYPVLCALKTYGGKWSYDYSVVLMGVRRLYEATGDERYLRYMRRNMEPLIHEDGTIERYRLDAYNIDNISNGKILFTLWRATGDERYKKALDLLYSQLQTHPRTKEGVFWHKQIYPWQIWLDGLYMGAPFYAEYLLTFRGGAGMEDVVHQFAACYRHTLDETSGLLRHAWDESRRQAWCDKATGQSPHVWGRAMGWYLLALSDVIGLLPEGEHRRTLGELFVKTARAVQRQQQENGVWYQVLDCPGRRGNYYEASCSCMFTAAMARGIRLGLLDESWRGAVDRAWRGIQEEFVFYTKEGWINLCRCCAVAGLGGDEGRDGTFAYYIGEPIITNDMKAFGAFLQAAVALENPADCKGE